MSQDGATEFQPEQQSETLSQKKKKLFLTILEAGKSKIEALAHLVSGEGLLLGS